MTLVFDELLDETNFAWLIRFNDSDIWLPKSQCEMHETDDLVYVPEWLVMNEGLENYEK